MERQEDRMPQDTETVEIDLKRLIRAVLNRALLVALSMVLCGAAALAGAYTLVTPKYQASALFYVNNSVSLGDSLSISAGDITTSKSLVDSYIVILKARTTLMDVIDYADLDYSYPQVLSMISAEDVNNTEIFKVTVTCEDPKEAEVIANAIAHVIPKRISSIIEGSSAKIVDSAVVPSAPSSPSYTNSTLWGAVFGLLLSIGVVVLIEIFDVTVKDKDDVQAACSYPILATVPDMNQGGKRGYYRRNYYRRGEYNRDTESRKSSEKENAEPRNGMIGQEIGFAASEAYKLLRTKLQYSFTDEQTCRVIAVSSAFAGEGKSVSCINLANSLAQLGKKVLLIDSDMRRPTQAEKLQLKKYPGLSEHLTGAADMDVIVQTCILPKEGMPFHVLTAGNTPPNPIELLNSEKMRTTIAALREQFDYIVMDLPPVGDVSDSLVASKLADGVLLVVRQDYVTRPALKDAVQQFEFVHAKILGVLVNCTADGTGNYERKYGCRYGRHGYRYGRYGYRYGRRRYDGNRSYEQEKAEEVRKDGKKK